MKSWKKLLSLTAACALSVSLLAGPDRPLHRL